MVDPESVSRRGLGGRTMAPMEPRAPAAELPTRKPGDSAPSATWGPMATILPLGLRRWRAEPRLATLKLAPRALEMTVDAGVLGAVPHNDDRLAFGSRGEDEWFAANMRCCKDRALPDLFQPRATCALLLLPILRALPC